MPEIRSVWAVVWPIILTNMLNVTVGMVDLKMVGSLGVDSIAAVGMANQVSMIVLVVMIAIGGGTSVLVAHAYGARDAGRVSRVASRSLSFMLLTALVLVSPLGLLISRPVLEMLGGEPRVVALGDSYLRILFVGAVFTMTNMAVSSILLGVGRTRVSLVLLVGVNALNIACNYVLIFGVGPVPAMGVRGAALGTNLARALGSLAGIWIMVSPRFPVRATLAESLTLDTALVKQIFFLGGPRSLQGIVRNVSRLIAIRIVTLLPDATRAVSAYSVSMQVRMVSSFIGLAFMAAAMSRVGQNLGAGDPREAERSGWIASAMATVLMTAVSVVFLVFPESIMGFFTTDRQVISMGRTFFIIIALTEPVMAFAFSLGGALRGGGDPISPFIYGSVSDIVVVAAAGYVFAVTLNMGFAGIALGMALSSVTRAVPIVWKWQQGKWKHTRL